MKRFHGMCVLAVALLGGCTFFNKPETAGKGVDRTRLEVYQQVASTACIQFGLDMLGRKSQWKPQSKEKPTIFSENADAKLASLSDSLVEKVDSAANTKERNQAERDYLKTMTTFLEKEAPTYMDLCQGLTRVYIQCDQFVGDRKKQNRCVAHEQREVLKQINAYLVRNYHPAGATSTNQVR